MLSAGLHLDINHICHPSLQNQSHVPKNKNRTFHVVRKRIRSALLWCKPYLITAIISKSYTVTEKMSENLHYTKLCKFTFKVEAVCYDIILE